MRLHILLLTFLVTSIVAPTAQAEYTETEVNVQLDLATQALLDPKVHSEVIKEFDFDSAGLPNILTEYRSQDRTQVDADHSLKMRIFNPPAQPVEEHSIQITTGKAPAGNSLMNFLNFNFYSTHYFQRHQPQLAAGTLRWKDLNEKQPWLEWQPQSHRYVVHDGGASLAVLKSLRRADRFKVYRGTTPQEADFFKFLNASTCRQNEIENLSRETRPQAGLHLALSHLLETSTYDCSEAKDHLIAVFIEDLKMLPYSQGSLFVSAEEEYASMFAKGVVEFFDIDFADLEKLLNRQQLYAGVESGSEIAFIGTAAVKVLAKGYLGSLASSREDMWGNSAKHPIWKSVGEATP